MPTAATSRHLAMVGSTGTTVLLLVAALVLLGLVMIAVTVWLVRATRTDHVALGPLEVMGDRSFRRADEEARSGLLTSARPAGAPTPAPVVPLEDDEEPAAAGAEASPDEPARDDQPSAGERDEAVTELPVAPAHDGQKVPEAQVPPAELPPPPAHDGQEAPEAASVPHGRQEASVPPVPQAEEPSR